MTTIKNKTVSVKIISATLMRAVLLVLGIFIITACNEGGGGGLLAGGGIGGTGISVGEISGFGSVFVNDVEFDTKDAQVVVNGKQVGAGNFVAHNVLALGMVVRVEGKFFGDGSGKADRIVFSENVKGPVTIVETLDTVVKKVVVLGQIVIIDDRTQFKNTDFNSLAAGDVLQISGWTEGTGIIQATFIANIEGTDDEVTAKGIITGVNDPPNNLRINQLSIDFSQADLRGFSDEQPAAGQLVLATGILNANGVLVAKQLSLEDDLGIDAAGDVEIEGIVTQFSLPQNFVLGTTAVLTDEATTFKGIEPDDIFVGIRLLIRGSLTKGRLLADEVIAKDKVNIEGNLDNVDYGQGELRLDGLNPLVVRTNDISKIFGDATTLNEIEGGEHVRILGYIAGKDKVEAIQVKVGKKISSKVKLQGPVTGIENPTVFVFNVDIDLSKMGDFETDTEGSVSRDKFLNMVNVGDTVSANGNLVSGAVEWKRIELLQE